MDITTILSTLSYWCITWVGIEVILAFWTFMAPANPVASILEQWLPTVLIENRRAEPELFEDTLIYRRPE